MSCVTLELPSWDARVLPFEPDILLIISQLDVSHGSWLKQFLALFNTSSHVGGRYVVVKSTVTKINRLRYPLFNSAPFRRVSWEGTRSEIEHRVPLKLGNGLQPNRGVSGNMNAYVIRVRLSPIDAFDPEFAQKHA